MAFPENQSRFSQFLKKMEEYEGRGSGGDIKTLRHNGFTFLKPQKCTLLNSIKSRTLTRLYILIPSLPVNLLQYIFRATILNIKFNTNLFQNAFVC
jgi:hypothetical protein